MRSPRSTRAVGSRAAIVATGIACMCLSTCGGSKKSGSDSDFACSLSIAGQEYCYAYSNLTADSLGSARSMCSNQNGKAVAFCSTDDLVGCCAVTQSGISFQSCYYFGTDSADEMACDAIKGTWTSGSGALGEGGGGGGGGGKGGGGGGGKGGGGGGGGSTGSSCTGSGVCCPDDYCTFGSAHGYEFAYSDANDGGSSSAQLSESGCVTGSARGAVCESASSPQSCYSSHWGAGIGFYLNQASGDGTTPTSFASAGSSGVTYALDTMSGSMRLVVGDSKTDYCATVTSTSGTIPWSGFNSSCWNTSGTPLSGPPSKFVSVRFQVVADTSNGNSTSFDFCVTKLSL